MKEISTLMELGKTLFRLSPHVKTTPPSSTPHQTFAESFMDDCMETVQSILNKWASNKSNNDSTSSSSPDCLFSANNIREAQLTIQAIKDLHSIMQHLLSVNPSSKKLVPAQKSMQKAMKFLETEFHRILKSHREYLDPESTASRWSDSASISNSDSDGDDDNAVDSDGDVTSSFHSERERHAMDDLKMIADCMISSGYTKECLKVYKTVRRSIVEETLHQLGMERITFAQIQKMDWQILETKIKVWLRAFKTAVRKLFYGERMLCEHLFSPSISITESCFAEITLEAALTLFGFPEIAAKGKKTSERMFRTLDMYEAIFHLLPRIETIFGFESTSNVRSKAVNSLTKLAETVRPMTADFESTIQSHKDASKSPIAGGGVHPLTCTVMNYLAFLSDYGDSLAQISADWQLTVPSPLPESLFSCKDLSVLSLQLAWLIFLMLCKIDGKAQMYKDSALSYLFLANNLQYVVARVQSSNLKLLLGGDWVAKHEATVKQHAAKYEKLGWCKVLTSLPDDPRVEMTWEEAEERFRSFNKEFDSARRKQSSWVVPDPQLRDEIKVSLCGKIVAVYEELYERNRVRLQKGSCRESSVKYTPEDLENYLLDLHSESAGSGRVLSSGSGTSSLVLTEVFSKFV